jgi:hypothetical protein
VVELPGNEGAFSGVLVESDRDYWIFENCRTVPTNTGHTPDAMPGRFWVKHNQSPAPYLVEQVAAAS